MKHAQLFKRAGTHPVHTQLYELWSTVGADLTPQLQVRWWAFLAQASDLTQLLQQGFRVSVSYE